MSLEDVRIISADDHLVEAGDLWQSRLPARYQEAAPRVVRRGQPQRKREKGRDIFTATDEGLPCDYWLFEGVFQPITQNFAGVGVPRSEMSKRGITYSDMRPGCYDPKERLADMDIVGVERSVCFPNLFPRFCGQRFMETSDRELGHLMVRAYNDWVIEEWCGGSGGRLIPMCVIPLWDPDTAAAEIRRNAARGARAITFCELPTELGLPSIHDPRGYWEPVFRACNETRTVICIHIFSSSTVPHTSADAPEGVSFTAVANNAILSMCDWLWSGVLERHSDLKVVYSEAEIGWIPYILERADRTWETMPFTYNARAVPRKPSEYFRDHLFGSFISDEHGVESLDRIGVGNVLFEVDYPHADSTWPHSLEVAKKELAHLGPDAVEAILRRNAINVFDLPESLPSVDA
jgi:predicted TIM-barrel fold metal-dependent hydrolase